VSRSAGSTSRFALPRAVARGCAVCSMPSLLSQYLPNARACFPSQHSKRWQSHEVSKGTRWAPPPTYVCFCHLTLDATPSGHRAIPRLCACVSQDHRPPRPPYACRKQSKYRSIGRQCRQANLLRPLCSCVELLVAVILLYFVLQRAELEYWQGFIPGLSETHKLLLWAGTDNIVLSRQHILFLKNSLTRLRAFIT